MTPLGGLDLTSIRMAIVISETRSLRRAARQLGASESTLSHRLRSLEDNLTVSLFHRSSEGVAPTNAGLRFLNHAREVIRILYIAASEAAADSAGLSGSLTIGLYTSLSQGRLREAIAAFLIEHSAVDLRLVETDRSNIIEGLRSRAIDLTVMIGPVVSTIGEALSLWSERAHVVLPASHRLTR